MSAKEHGKRAFIIVIVAVFFLTSLATTGLVLYDTFRNKNANSVATVPQETVKLDQNKEQNQENKLEGTKLSGFTPVSKVDQLQVTDPVVGTGAEATASSTVTAHYTGALASDGTIFQSSKDTGQPFTSPLSGLIAGWQQGIPGMKVGGTRRLVIPAAQAYGEQATGNIPANSDLVFDIELIEVK
jgi:FKBP-type peptidyl-prolyl cis-trans isomerase